MSPTRRNSASREQWLRTLYSAGWDLYQHEDNLGQSRNTTFMSVQAGMIAVISALTPAFLKLRSLKVWGRHTLPLSTFSLGAILLLVGWLGHRLCGLWSVATNAARRYVHLRRIGLVAIERLAAIDDIGLATAEAKYQKLSKTSTEESLTLFDTAGLEDLSVWRLGESSGWTSQLRLIRRVQALWLAVVLTGGVLLVGSSLLLVLRNR